MDIRKCDVIGWKKCKLSQLSRTAIHFYVSAIEGTWMVLDLPFLKNLMNILKDTKSVLHKGHSENWNSQTHYKSLQNNKLH